MYGELRNISKGRVFDEHFLMAFLRLVLLSLLNIRKQLLLCCSIKLVNFSSHWLFKRFQKIYIRFNGYVGLCYSQKERRIDYHISESVAIGEIIVKSLVKKSLDGVVLDGDSMLDTRALTGESVREAFIKGTKHFPGCMNQTGC